MSAARPQSTPLRGLYTILDPNAAAGRSLLDVLRWAHEGGARLFQYRAKQASMLDAYRQAQALRDLTADLGGIFIVNDRCDLALAVEADGVHLGQEDLPLEQARQLLGARRLIGVSAHRPEQVTQATLDGADYLGYGPIFGTASKADHEPIVGIAGLKAVRGLTLLPIFAIGGIKPDAVEAIKAAGADGVAVISAVAGAPDVRDAAALFVRRWSA